MKKPIKVRVGVLIQKDDKILVTKISKSSGDFFVLPGGGMKSEEGISECAVREVKEETFLNIEPGKILFVKDNIADMNHGIEIIVQGSVISGELGLGDDPDHAEHEKNLVSVEWKSIAELKSGIFHPKQIKDFLNQLPSGAVYLGKHSFPEE